MANNYLNNKDLYIQLIISKARGRLTRKAEKMFEILGTKAIRRFSYYNNDDRQDCLQNGLVDMYSNWYNFDEDKTDNAFAYFTEIFKRGAAKQFNQLHKKKGDPDHNISTISINSSGENGGGIESLI